MEAPADALAYLDRQLPQDALVLVTGSFYTVGPALAWLEACDILAPHGGRDCYGH
jgi:hypothetical protein